MSYIRGAARCINQQYFFLHSLHGNDRTTAALCISKSAKKLWSIRQQPQVQQEHLKRTFKCSIMIYLIFAKLLFGQSLKRLRFWFQPLEVCETEVRCILSFVRTFQTHFRTKLCPSATGLNIFVLVEIKWRTVLAKACAAALHKLS